MTSNDDVRSVLATLVRDEPALPSGAEDIERRGIRRRNRRRMAFGAVALLPVLAGGVAVVTWPGPTPVPIPAPAQPGPIDGAQLATGFPIGSAVDAVSGALPPGAVLAELPMDIGWQEGGTLRLSLADGTPLTVAVSGGSCAVTSSALTTVQAGAVGEAVCVAWREAGSPEIIPTGPAGPEQPELAAQ